jgi:hypothetical protein
MNIIMATNKKTVIVMLLNHLIGQYTNFAKMKVRDQSIILGQILAIIHTCVLAMVKFPVDNDLKRKVFELLELHIQIHGVES